MSVVGIDFGNLQSIIAVARNRGIDVICNEVSNRTTPSLVSFGQKQRYLGETAKSQEMSNFKNTVGSLKRLVGRPFNDPEIAEIEASHVNADLVDVNNSVGAKVKYLGEERVFSASQLVAMYFTKLKETTLVELKQPSTSRLDVVISVPPWFTDNQRASIMDAADVAGLNCLRVMNDTTASALGYGITKTDLPEDKPRNVMFVDVGHSNCSVAIVAFKKGELTVKSNVWDKDFGGRNFDQLLLDHFAAEFKEKYKIDVMSNNKAIFRLRAGCERAKKVLSANSQAPLNIESIMDDKDVSSMLSRSDFEAMSAHLIDRIEPTLNLALADSGLSLEDLDALEVVGGCTRIPALKERLAAFFGRDVSTTLNQDEAVARGCALQCAMLSPVFKVRDFAIHDLAPHPIKFVWEPTPEKPNPLDCQLEVFTRQQTVPSSKTLTFYRKEPFFVEAHYTDMSRLPKGTPEVVGRYHVKDVKVPENEDSATIKVRARINLNGILSVEGGYLVEPVILDEKTDETVPMETDNGPTPNGDAAEGGKDADSKPAKKKRSMKKVEIPVESEIKFGLDSESLATYKTMEIDMARTDQIVAATEEAKNALEEYVYDTRSKVEGLWREFVAEEEKAQFLPTLNAAEEWLYEEGDEATKEVYSAKLQELKSVGDPILERYRQFEERPRAENLLRDTVSSLMAAANSRADNFSHVTQEERAKVLQRCEEKINWLEEQLLKQEKLPKFKAPLVTAREILDQRESLNAYATPIIFKPKPQPKPEEKAEEKPVESPVGAKAEQTPAPEATSEMDID